MRQPLGPRRRPVATWFSGFAAATLAAGVAATVVPVGAAQAGTPVTVWMVGDSTMANSAGTGIVGWGRQLSGYLTSDATVTNSAVGGRSIQTWMYEGAVSSSMGGDGECALTSTTPSTRYQYLLDTVRSGDVVVIGFGINDGDPSCPRHVGTSRYQQLMQTLATQMTAKGARPIFITAPSAVTCSGSTAVANRGFGDQVRAAGWATSTPVVDMSSLTLGLYNKLGLCPNNGDYTSGAVGDFFANDHTHFSEAGATQVAGLFAKAVADQNLPLAAYLRSSNPSSSTSSTSTSTTTYPPTGTPLVQAGLCLDAENGSRTSGAALVYAPCTGTSAQWWMFSSAGELRTGDQSLCVDAYAKGTTSGTKLVLWKCNGGANQQFGRASDAIRGGASGLCLVPSGSAVAGAGIVLGSCVYDGSQAWATSGGTTTTTSTTSTTTKTTEPTTTEPTTTKTSKTKTTKTKTTTLKYRTVKKCKTGKNGVKTCTTITKTITKTVA